MSPEKGNEPKHRYLLPCPTPGLSGTLSIAIQIAIGIDFDSDPEFGSLLATEQEPHGRLIPFSASSEFRKPVLAAAIFSAAQSSSRATNPM